jgi:hypothetical protein
MSSKCQSILVFVSVLFLLVPAFVCQGQTPSPTEPQSAEVPTPAEVLDGELRIAPKLIQTTIFGCKLKGKPIPQGETRKYVLRLKNASDQVFEFDQIKVSCSCLKVLCSQTTVKSDESLEMTVEFVARKSRRSEFAFALDLFLRKELVGHVHVSGELANTLALNSPGIFESNGPVSSWDIPVVHSAPVDIGRVKVELGETLRDFVAELVQKKGQAVVQISAPETALGIAGVSGHVKIADPTLGVHDLVFVTFTKTPVVRVSPMLARFVEDQNHPGTYKATFLVQDQTIVPSESTDEKSDQQLIVENQITSISCTSKVHRVQLEKKRIKDSLFRVNVRVNRSKDDSEWGTDFDLFWEIKSLNGNLSFVANCRFMELEK